MIHNFILDIKPVATTYMLPSQEKYRLRVEQKDAKDPLFYFVANTDWFTPK